MPSVDRWWFVLPVLASLLPIGTAHAANTTVASVGFQYVPRDVTIAPGDTMDLVNADSAPHNIVSDTTDRRGAQLFRSELATTGQRVVVKGVEKLPAGSYTYYCSIHPQMRGSVTVGKRTTPFVTQPVGAVPTPTSITFFDNAMYVASYSTGNVMRLPVLAGGVLGEPTAYATGFTSPLGVAFAPNGTMYVADSHQAGALTVGRVRALARGGGAADRAAVVVDGLPNGRHNTNGLAVHNGRLYIANGNNTDDGTAGGPKEQLLSGTLLSVPLTARNLPARASTALLVEARGMRNPYDVAFRPGTHEAWLPTNGPDALEPYGDDLLHRVDVRGPAANFGFPACIYKTEADGTLSFAQNPKVAARCDPRHKRPETSFGLHVSANGLAFGPAEGAWDGDLFVAEFGSNTGSEGHKVVRVPIDAAGRAGRPEDVLVASSPLDLCFGPSGTGMYVADFGSGTITLIRAVV